MDCYLSRFSVNCATPRQTDAAAPEQCTACPSGVAYGQVGEQGLSPGPCFGGKHPQDGLGHLPLLSPALPGSIPAARGSKRGCASASAGQAGRRVCRAAAEFAAAGRGCHLCFWCQNHEFFAHSTCASAAKNEVTSPVRSGELQPLLLPVPGARRCRAGGRAAAPGAGLARCASASAEFVTCVSWAWGRTLGVLV